MEKELFPYLPALPEMAAFSFRKAIGWITDDAVFHNYDQGKYSLISRLIPHKIDRVMQWAAVVTAGNDYLMQRAQVAGAKKSIAFPYRDRSITLPKKSTCRQGCRDHRLDRLSQYSEIPGRPASGFGNPAQRI